MTQAQEALSRTSGVPAGQLELDEEAAATLLELARVAAHESGERTNAPLLCYLLGRARAGAASLDELDQIVRSTS